MHCLSVDGIDRIVGAVRRLDLLVTVVQSLLRNLESAVMISMLVEKDFAPLSHLRWS